MSILHLNDTHLRTAISGDGEPVVLVHGSWADGTSWDASRELLAQRFHVVAYDRRGHSGSGAAPAGPLPRRVHEDDLAALIEALGRGRVHLVANSFGGLIALGLATRRPDLVRSVCAHEPPAIGAAAGQELEAMAGAAMASVAATIAEIETGDAVAGTRRFMEDVALGPGAWELLPAALQAIFVQNAHTFLAEQRDPLAFDLDLDAVSRFDGDVLITRGDAGPRWLALLAERLVDRIAGARGALLGGAGHAPHYTHPGGYASLVSEHVAGALVV